MRFIRAVACLSFSAVSWLPVTALLLPAVAAAQDAGDYSLVTDERLANPEPGNWLMFRRTYDGWGFSPLDEIDTSSAPSGASRRGSPKATSRRPSSTTAECS